MRRGRERSSYPPWMVLGRLARQVERSIERRALFPRGAGLLLGCSGGPDSAALMQILWELRARLELRLEVAAVDHGLRPEAAQEIDLARAQAEGLGLPFHPLTLSLEPGPGLQARARRERYAALLEAARDRDLGHVAVGHTLDDQAETVVARLLRGAGLRGLGGIRPRRGDGVVRPLLDLRRAELRAYLEAQGIPFAEDPSNQDPRFLRARVRAHLLPTLAEENEALSVKLAELADDARAASELLEARGAALLEQLAGPASRRAGGRSSLPIRALRGLAPAELPVVLRLWLAQSAGEQGTRAQLESLVEAVRRGSGEVRLKGGWGARATRSTLSLFMDNRPLRGSPERRGDHEEG